MRKGFKLVGSSIVIAVIASVSAIIIYQAIQSGLFSELLKDTKFGRTYTGKYATITIYNITNEDVRLSIKGDEQICKLKERESCYSGCLKVTVSDIKADSADIDISDEIACEVGRFANQVGTSISNAISRFFSSFGR